MVTVVIAADICPIGQNLPLFISGNAEALYSDLLPEIRSADISIANLECPLAAVTQPIRKTGPCFIAPPKAMAGIANGGFKMLCLANNHILDQGQQGVHSTLEACQAFGIIPIGAGRNLEDAAKLCIRIVNGLRIGFLAAAEHEFSIASSDKAGANPLDLITLARTIKDRRDDFDFLVVLLHGGHEFHVPSPHLQKTCRFIVELGASAVVVQHPHCLGGIEQYREGTIVYGQGALVMDEEIYRSLPSFHVGFLLKLTFARNLPPKVELIPFTQSDPEPGARRLSPAREIEFKASLAERSNDLHSSEIVRERWVEFCRKNQNTYISGILGYNRLLRALNKSLGIARFLAPKRQRLGIRNIVSCETHREALLTILDRQLL